MTEENKITRSTAKFPVVDLSDYIITKSTMKKFEITHVIEKPELRSTEALKYLNFIFDIKVTEHKTSVDPKLLQLKFFDCNKQQHLGPENFSPVFVELINRFGLSFASDETVNAEELKRQIVHALHFGNPRFTKKIAR